MWVRCHFCPVSAYRRVRDLEVLLILSGTPQRGFCIQLREGEDKTPEGWFKFADRTLGLKHSHVTTPSAEANSAVRFLTSARKSRRQNKKVLWKQYHGTTSNYNHLLLSPARTERKSSVSFIIHQSITGAKHKTYRQRSNSHLSVISLHHHAKREEGKVLKLPPAVSFSGGDKG